MEGIVVGSRVHVYHINTWYQHILLYHRNACIQHAVRIACMQPEKYLRIKSAGGAACKQFAANYSAALRGWARKGLASVYWYNRYISEQGLWASSFIVSAYQCRHHGTRVKRFGSYIKAIQG